MTETPVEMGLRHVREGGERIARQRQRMDELARDGHRDAWLQAEKFLVELEAFQRTAESHLEEAIDREQARKQPA